MAATISALVRPPSDLAKRLRELAADADAGRVTDVIVCYVNEGEYGFTFGSSLAHSITMATLLQQSAIDRFRK